MKSLTTLVFTMFSLQIVSPFIISQPSEHSSQYKELTKGNKISESIKNNVNLLAILISIV